VLQRCRGAEEVGAGVGVLVYTRCRGVQVQRWRYGGVQVQNSCRGAAAIQRCRGAKVVLRFRGSMCRFGAGVGVGAERCRGV
jgi:hypothetical protein